MNNETINLPYLTSEDKDTTFVAFLNNSFYSNQGVDGLKYYLVMMYLRITVQQFGVVRFSLNEIISGCGYSIKSNNGSIKKHFVFVLNEIIKRHNVVCNYNSNELNALSLNKQIILTLPTNKNIFSKEDHFVMFTVSEFEKIVNSKEKVNKCIMAGVYLFIKKHLFNNSSVTAKKISYPSKSSLKTQLGFKSDKTIESAISALINLKMLYKKSDLYIVLDPDSMTVSHARSVYALKPEDLTNNSYKQLEADLYDGKPLLEASELPDNVKIIYQSR